MHQPIAPFSRTLVERLAGAERVAVLTGAGVSAESGVPTFRDPGGLWQQFRPEELANVDAFLANPVLVQGWYRHRREVVDGCAPNPGHAALAELEAWVTARGGDFLLATQNVDGLHARAGSERVVELHGSLTRSLCQACGRPATRAETDAAAESPSRTGSGSEPARCPACGGLVRPDVVWFGEALDAAHLDAAAEAAASADVFLSVGTSAVVYPAASLPLIARAHGAYTAEINPEPSELAGALDEQIPARAGDVLPALVDAVRAARR